MSAPKIIVKVSYALIAVLVIVLVGLLVYQQHLIKQISSSETPAPSAAGVAEPQSENSPKATALSGSRPEQVAPDVEELKYHLDATEEELDMAREDLASEIDRQAEQARNNIELQKKMLENPAMKKMIRTNMKSALDMTYGALFEELGLSDEKLAAFKELLADQQMQALDSVMGMMDPSLTEEEKAETQQRLSDQKTQFDSDLSALLGADNFETYDTYRERLAERQYAVTFSEALQDSELTGEQEQALIETMYDARKALETEYGIDSQNIETLADDALTEKQIERMSRTFDRYIESAQGVLTESQAAQFETHMKEQQEIATMSIKMARQLYGAATD